MLNVTLVPNREFLTAQAATQKMFVMLKLRPNLEVSNTHPATNFVFLIDTSGSMCEVVLGETTPTGKIYEMDGQTYQQVTGGKSKIDVVIESLIALINSNKLTQNDRIAIIQFDDQASTVIGLTPATEKVKIEQAIHSLKNFSGGTQMAKGMKEAFKLLATGGMSSRRVLIFTDGMTFDEELCRELAADFANTNLPITALGIGEYAEDLLIHLGDTTGGRLFHVTTEEENGVSLSINKLPHKIIEEFAQAQQDVITNLGLYVKTVQGVELSRIARAYPEPAEFPITQEPYPLGNAAGNDETVFILEFNITNRPAAKVRIAQLGLTYDVPGKNQRGELPPQNLIIQFVAGEINTPFNPEVAGYLQQLSTIGLIKQATQLAQTNPEKADQLLESARRMTVKIGNEAMTGTILNAQDELRKTRRISDSTRKTIKMGAKGKTIRMNDNPDEELSQEAIRKISGT